MLPARCRARTAFWGSEKCRGDKRRWFYSRLGGHGHLVESRAEVKCTIPQRAREGVEAPVDAGQRVRIFPGQQVELAIVHAETDIAVLFLDEDYVRGPIAVTGLDYTLALHLFEQAVDDWQLRSRLGTQGLPKGGLSCVSMRCCTMLVQPRSNSLLEKTSA